jgi:hypothetical protein
MAKKNIKQVTFPIGTLPVFEELAKIELRLEKESVRNPSSIDEEEFIKKKINELASDIFIHSILPSDAAGVNPQTPKVAVSFYDAFADMFDLQAGAIPKMIKKNKPKANQTIIKNNITRIKSSTINLVQLFIEISDFRLKTKASRRSANEKEYIESSFEYPKNAKKESDYEKLCEVELNRYTRLCIAAWFFKMVTDVMVTDVSQIKNLIQKASNVTPKKFNKDGTVDYKAYFAQLRNNKNRKEFVSWARDAIQIGAQTEMNV